MYVLLCSPQQQISTLLQLWKQQEGKKASVERFVLLCRQVVGIDDQLIRDTIMEQSKEIQSPSQPVLL